MKKETEISEITSQQWHESKLKLKNTNDQLENTKKQLEESSKKLKSEQKVIRAMKKELKKQNARIDDLKRQIHLQCTRKHFLEEHRIVLVFCNQLKKKMGRVREELEIENANEICG
jgi:septal ring factor EnvC (AmiA/AmiB activator)